MSEKLRSDFLRSLDATPPVGQPLGKLVNRVVENITAQPGDSTILEFIALGVAQQQHAVTALIAAEQAGRPMPMGALEVLRFAAEKNHGLAKQIMQRALKKSNVSSAGSPPVRVHPGEHREGGKSRVAALPSADTGEA